MSDVTYGRWNPDEVRERVLDDTWPQESPGGLVLLTPTSVSGTNAFILSSGVVSIDDTSYVNIQGVFTSDYDHYVIYIVGRANATTTFYLSQSGQDFTTGYYRYYITTTNQSVSQGQVQTMDAIPGSTTSDAAKVLVYDPAVSGRPKTGRINTVTAASSGSMTDSFWTLPTTSGIDGFSLSGTVMLYRIGVYGVVS
jgi:hypothetical protein